MAVVKLEWVLGCVLLLNANYRGFNITIPILHKGLWDQICIPHGGKSQKTTAECMFSIKNDAVDTIFVL